MCQRTKQGTGFRENITPIRLRTTVLTDLYDQAKDTKLAQAAAGHTTSAMMLKYYSRAEKLLLRQSPPWNEPAPHNLLSRRKVATGKVLEPLCRNG